jgi:hypothetical protein
VDVLTPEKSRQLLAAVSDGLISGAIDANTARSVAYTLQVDRQLRDSEALARRMTELERQLASMNRAPGVRAPERSNGHTTAEQLRELRARLIDA